MVFDFFSQFQGVQIYFIVIKTLVSSIDTLDHQKLNKHTTYRGRSAERTTTTSNFSCLQWSSI